MNDLSEFLLARIAEDEAVARGDHHRQAQEQLARVLSYRSGIRYADALSLAAEQLLDVDLGWSSARVLAECEAKRGLLRHLWVVGNHTALDHCDRCQVIRYFGEVYSDHPEYDEEWRA